MAGEAMIPRPSAPATDRDGRFTREWYAYLQWRLESALSPGGDVGARLDALAREVSELLGPFQIMAAPGIALQGTPEGGLVRIGIADSGVTPGSYIHANLTVGADGRVTAAADGPVGDLIAGPNVSLSGSLTGRLVGAGNVTVSAAGGGGGGGCLQFVGEVVLAADSSLIQFTGLDSSDAIAWRMEANLRARAGQLLESQLRVNGDSADTGGNYSRQTITANGTSVSTARAGNNDAFYTSTNGGAASGSIEIRPASTGMLATMMYARDTGAANLRYQTAALEWVGTGPITALALASRAANNFAAGSAVRLYKVTATPPTPDYGGLVNAANDAAAAAAGVAVGKLYRNGSTLMVRVA